MSRATPKRRTGRYGRKAGASLRFCVALWLVLQILYTPIHLYQVPHSDDAELSVALPLACAAAFVADESHEDHGDHQRHPAAQHKFKALRTERAALAEVFLTSEVASVEAGQDCPTTQVFGFSGLSPPELPRCWQFLFRAALPVRAPSCLS